MIQKMLNLETQNRFKRLCVLVSLHKLANPIDLNLASLLYQARVKDSKRISLLLRARSGASMLVVLLVVLLPNLIKGI